MDMNAHITKELKKLKDAGLERQLHVMSGPTGPRGIVSGKDALIFCSNDYLGLANDPEMKRAAIEAVEKFGAGAGASRLVSGTMEPHARLEARIMAFMEASAPAYAALVFNSGYHANLACITTLAGRSTDVFSDRLNHASIVDACVMSRANVRRYPNNDIAALEGALKSSTASEKLIITEGVFSMDGTLARLDRIIPMLDRYEAKLLLDDAHALFVMGKHGRGTLEHYNIKRHPSIIQVGTLGKAAGSFGAFAIAGADIIELFVSKARPFIYTTALPPSVCAASTKAFDIIEQRPGLRERLWKNVSQFKAGLRLAGISFIDSGSQIIPVIIGSSNEAVRISRELLERGVFIQAIRPPTVPENTARLRVTLSAAHTEDDIEYALSVMKEVFKGCK